MHPHNETIDEAAKKLRVEIELQNHELNQLERFAGTVHASRCSNLPNGIQQAQSISKTTSKIIEQLQRELDVMRLTAESARLQFEAEHRDRLTLVLKCEDLEASLATVRQEMRAHTPTLARSDQALYNARATIQDLNKTLQETQESKSKLETLLQLEKDTTHILRDSLQRESHNKSRTEVELRVLSESFRKFKNKTQSDVEVIVASLQDVKDEMQKKMRSDRIMLEELLLSRSEQEVLVQTSSDQLNNILSVREAYLAQIKSRLREMEKKVESQLLKYSELERQADLLKEETQVALNLERPQDMR